MSDKEILLFGFLGGIAIMLFILIFLMLKNKDRPEDNSSKLIQDHLFNISKNLDDKLSKNFETNSKISRDSNKTIEDITRKLTSLEETNKQIKDIWWQLEWLEKILNNSKQRGILWEYFLENLLKNVFAPDNYKLQYKFNSWEQPDAVIFIDKKKLAIDSKFSLDNYNKIIYSENILEKEKYELEFIKDLKIRINETSKYIKPEEGTMDFAFMFIPSEWIYYDLLVNKIWSLKQNLIEYAFKEKKVIIVSPTSFYAYLQTVMQGLRALKIENQAQEIKKQIWNLGRHLSVYEEYFSKLWNTLNTCTNHYDNASKEFKKIDKDIFKITWEKVLKIEK